MVRGDYSPGSTDGDEYAILSVCSAVNVSENSSLCLESASELEESCSDFVSGMRCGLSLDVKDADRLRMSDL